MKKKSSLSISLKGIRQNNLKNIDIEIPKNQLIVITGLSGSGKSSLAFDVIQKESQRHYFSHLSPASSRLGSKIQKSKVNEISGLNACISVSQNKGNFNPRSTVGTISEIYDYLRLLYARVGKSPVQDLFINRSLFSFNSTKGACSHCKGLGVEDKISADLLIEDENRSVRDKAFKVTQPNGYTMYSQVTIDALNQVCEAHGFNVDIPWKDLSKEQQYIVLNGSDIINIPYGKHTLESRMKWSGITAKPREEGVYKGIIPVMEEILKRDRNPNILKYAKSQVCSICSGQRLSFEALSVTINTYSIADLNKLSLRELKRQLQSLELTISENEVAQPILEAIFKRITQLEEFGLGYLQLNRNSNSLNGGELQGIRLARQVHSELRNVTFVFDEPSIGMHAAYNPAIIKALGKLVNNGNTVILVEHDAQCIRSADWIIEIGPKAGEHGGEIMFSGSIHDFKKSKHPSLSRDFVLNTSSLEFQVRNPDSDQFVIQNACINNLKNIDVEFKYKQLNVVVGVSGAGKSSLIYQSLLPLINGNYHKQINATGNPQLQNLHFKKVYEVDQSPIGKTVRSTPATYTKIHDLIRDLFASLPESKEAKYTKSTFSYNSKGGRCEQCEGAGRLETGMHFLGNVESVCPSCNGKRYRKDILKIKFNKKSISDILDMSISIAKEFFNEHPKLQHALQLLDEIGLGYLSLGQSSNTLSGGEAQRVKLATELIRSKPNKGSEGNLYILNEPSTGLHHYDLQILMNLLSKMIQQGNTLILIEHNEEIIAKAQHLIELGPEAGEEGGQLIYSGSYQEFIKGDSFTSFALKDAQAVISRENSHIVNKGISLDNVRTHHLNIEHLTFEDSKHTVISGPSGSGKSSLVFDTLYAEARNRFMESFPAYLRQNLMQQSSAKFDSIKGLTPAIALKQRNDIKDPRSTLGSLTGLATYYRLLYARMGTKPSNSEIDLNMSSSYSFNHSEGACEHCKGLGKVLSSNAQLLFDYPEKSIFDGTFRKHKSLDFYADPYGQYMATIKEVGKRFKIDFNQPIEVLNAQAMDIILFGSGEESYDVKWEFNRKGRTGTHEFNGKWKGLTNLLLDEYYRKNANGKGDDVIQLLHEVNCPICHGMRLKDSVLVVSFYDLNISQLMLKSIDHNIEFFQNIVQKGNSIIQSQTQLFEDILTRLKDLQGIGLGYLHIDRRSKSLSGGELQKVMLASILNSKMSGITYVLDEPTSGLHASDTSILLNSINKIVNNGNTVLSVEHNIDFIRAADHHIALGPGAGEKGGKIVDIHLDDILNSYFKDLHLSHSKSNYGSITIKGAHANNLKNISVEIQKRQLNAICGISGSGKTSLMRDVLYASWKSGRPSNCDSVGGLEGFDNVLWIDRKGAESSSMSIVATYIDVYNSIKKCFAEVSKQQNQKWKATHFGFQNKETQCPECKGNGYIHHKLDFINDVITTCETCKGRRFIPEILDIKYNSYSISEVLEISLSKVKEVFENDNVISSKLTLAIDLGLGYLKLGQLSSQLSGGESQRLKIVRELLKQNKDSQLIILDEPGKGLHITDLPVMTSVFDKLVSVGHTLVIIEHNPFLLLKANYIIELGEGAGEKGGSLLYQGLLYSFLKQASTKTSKYLNTYAYLLNN